jgi:hypoxanthine-guanine phosphoribosyltransferase
MPPVAGWAGFYRDARGNRLAQFDSTPDGSGHILRLRGPREVVDQVLRVAPEYVGCAVPPGDPSNWTHCLRSPMPMRPEVPTLLALLTSVISLPQLPNVSAALALDWYKLPQVGIDSYDWPNTQIGDLVSRGKYLYKHNAVKQRVAGLDLAARLRATIDSHAGLQQSSTVLNVPGHDRTRVSFGSRLAATVARDQGLRFVRVESRSEFRAEAKSVSSAERVAMLRDQFILSQDLREESVLIIDDVFKSGVSMTEVARAARAAGAADVQGICAVRTMRAG